MTTLDRCKSAPLSLGGSVGSAFDDDDASSESLGSSIPEFIMLQVILPDGSIQKVEVNSGKQMLDLTIQLTKSNHLSPADYTLAMYHPETGRPLNYKASQMIGALRVDTVHIVNKKASRDKTKRHTVAQPFEMTYRLAVNLPKTQKTVLRVNPQSTLADIFKMVCKERNLDPYKHELRHPTQQNLALNMANPLASYNINEITVVNITAPDSANNATTPTSPGTQSIYDSHWTYNNSMPRKKADSQPPPPSGEQSQPSYMPGMTEKKKRKSFLGLFSRKKEGKFKLSEATYHAPSTSSLPQTYEPPPVTNSNKPQAEVRPQPQIQQTSMSSLDVQRTSTSSLSSQKTSSSSSEVTGQVQKPLRKKRLAPAPPVNKPLSVNTEAVSTSQQVHSRGSSHSSGFDETSVSPLESPGSSSGKVTNNAQTKTSIQATSLDSSGHMGNGHVTSHVIIEESHAVSSSAASTVSRTSSMSTGGDSALCSLPRNKKKRPAPPPPPGTSRSTSITSSPAHSTTTPPSGSTHSSVTHTPSHVTSPNNDDSEETFDTRELQMAIAEELKKEVSVDGYMDESVPESPRIGQDNELNTEVVQSRELLQRQKSDVAVFVDQMNELTEGVTCDDTKTGTTTITITNTDTTIEQAEHSNQNDSVHVPVIADTMFEDKSHELVYDNEQVSVSTQETQDILYDLRESEMVRDTHIERDVGVTSVYVEHDIPVVQEVIKTAELEVDSDMSSVPSLTAYDISEELSDTDTEKEQLPDSIEPVVLVKKKIVPEFTLNLEMEDEHNGDTSKDSEEEFTELTGGEFTTTIKMDDYLAAMTAFDDIAEEPDLETSEAQEPNEGSPSDQQQPRSPRVQQTHVTSLPVSSHYQRKDSWTDSWQETPERLTRSVHADNTQSYPGDVEIRLDNIDVMYVSPDQHSEGTSEQQFSPTTSSTQYSRESSPQQPFVGAHKLEGTPVVHDIDHSHQKLNFEDQVASPPFHDVLQADVDADVPESVSPSGGMSLFSLVSGVKSSKSDLKLHASPPKPELVLAESTSPQHAAPVAHSPSPRESEAIIKTMEPELKTLRDAYSHVPEKEPETFIIHKPAPYQMPPPELREQISASKTTSRSTAIEESKQPSGEAVEKQNEVNLQPIVYKTESLAVSRRAQRMPVADLEKKPAEQEQPRFWGPRPWSARGASEPIPDVNEALSKARLAVSLSRELPPSTDYLETDSPIATPTEYSTPHKETPSPVTGMYSPGKTPSFQNSPKEKCTEISFSPRSEEEEGHSLMEDKSITMLAYPVERKSILKTSAESESDTRPYRSSVALDSSGMDGDRVLSDPQDYRHYNSSLGLTQTDMDENSNVDPMSMKPIAKVMGRSMEAVSDTKDKAKKSLQQQYADLQQQFSKWQNQLMDNQKLLTENNMISQSSDLQNMPPPPPLDTYQSSLSEEKRKAQAIAAENYRRLSTPRPFGHRSSEPLFKPIIKKRSSFEDQFSNDIPVDVSHSGADEVIPLEVDSIGPLPPPVNSPSRVTGRTRPKFEPTLDPREELMIAIRNAKGRKILTKSTSLDSNW